MKTKLFILFGLFIVTSYAGAYSFKVDNIAYEIITDSTVYVTWGVNYKGAINIPDSVTYNSVNYSVTSIGGSAFYECQDLTTVTIPNSVMKISSYAFTYSGLTSITLPNSITDIYAYAFSGCSKLTSINIPTSITYIRINTFAGCTALTSIDIPNAVTSIGNSAFSGCSGLKSINWGNSILNIGSSTFSGCSGLTNINIPNSVTSIGDYAYSGCSGLTSITIPNTVMSIGSYAFAGCTGLTSITIPNSVTSIADHPFDDCTSLTNIIVDNSNLNYSSLNGILFNKSQTTLIYYPIGKTAQNYTIPSSVLSIGSSAFVDCVALNTITIPNSVKTIENSAFSSFSGLKSINIPNSITSIGDCAFYGCSGLTSITIPNSVTSIGDYAFNGCSGLMEIHANSSNPLPLISPAIFEYINKETCTLYVPVGSKAIYQLSNWWKSFKNIVEEDTTSGINTFKINELNIEIRENQLIFSYLPQHAIVTVMDISGKVIYSKVTNSESLSMFLPNHGTYVVRVGNKVTKVFN